VSAELTSPDVSFENGPAERHPTSVEPRNVEGTMLSHIRRTAFFAADSLRGGGIRRNLADIEDFYDRPGSQNERVTRALKRLLVHAAGTTKFYSEYAGSDDLSRYPVITKKQLQDSPHEFLSSKYPISALTKRKTSGSYSTPMSVYFSGEKMARQYAELIYYNRVSGLDVGEKYVNITTNRKGRLEKFLKNLVVINPAVMDEEWYDETVHSLVCHRDVSIIGFPSVLHALANYLGNNVRGGEIRLGGIITIAEALNPAIRKSIETAFRCPVYNRYATMETGVVGHSIRTSHDLHVNRASYVVEILAYESDRPVAEGEAGRVVVTDLFSEAMPLIRYETGDTAVLVSKEGDWAKRIGVPEGRIVETIYRTDGRIVSWAVLYDLMVEVPYLIQYQFRQTGEGRYELHLVTGSKFSKDDEKGLEREFQEILGQDAYLEFHYPSSVEALPSGKRPMIINTFRR
jgi:phenylacetate-CoA ligase